MSTTLDVDFDFRDDTPPGKDPDKRSPKLREYHRALWSKPLPSGHSFELRTDKPGVYLYHSSDLGKFFLSSDSAIPTFHGEGIMKDVIARLAEGERTAWI
jgi:hypothetical protein